jgi:uncharacterized protein (DUF1684 family)
MGGFQMNTPFLQVSWLSLALMLTFQACEKKSASEEAGFASYETELLQERREKDAVFRSGAQSPLPPAERSGFAGLKYYPPNPALRFHTKLNRYPAPKAVRLGTNTGEIQSGLRYGYFEFEVNGVTCRLQAYRMDDTPAEGGPLLFIPFKDATSGSETYGAGRYIDLHENTSGIYDLDFNRAFNPYCAYGKGYSCPVPPEENRLAVPIRAGEKKYE